MRVDGSGWHAFLWYDGSSRTSAPSAAPTATRWASTGAGRSPAARRPRRTCAPCGGTTASSRIWAPSAARTARPWRSTTPAPWSVRRPSPAARNTAWPGCGPRVDLGPLDLNRSGGRVGFVNDGLVAGHWPPPAATCTPSCGISADELARPAPALARPAPALARGPGPARSALSPVRVAELRRSEAWRWPGLGNVADMRYLPLLILVVLLAGAVVWWRREKRRPGGASPRRRAGRRPAVVRAARRPGDEPARRRAGGASGAGRRR